MPEQNDKRYPYTYAADYVRLVAGHGSDGAKLSRSDAARLTEKIAAAQGVAKEDLSKALADAYLREGNDLAGQAAQEMFQRAAIDS